MRDANQYPGLEYTENTAGADEQRFWVVAPAIAQAMHWALTQTDQAGEEYMLECLDTIYSYGAQEGLAGSQLDKIYEYAIAQGGTD